MQRVLLIFGTRPEAVKMCPLARELMRRGGVEATVCVTGQHRAMLDDVLRFFGVTPKYDLNLLRPGATLTELTGAMLAHLPPVLRRERPDLVLVHGDTATAFAAALCAFELALPVGHVEAGLRSGDLAAPFPEEFDRRVVDMLSRVCFAPTAEARDNLLREGKAPEAVFLTGNTVVDALRATVREGFDHPLLRWAAGHPLVLFTAHRRESRGAPMGSMLSALRRLLGIAPEARAVFPVHGDPALRALAERELAGCENLRLTPPLPVETFHNLLSACRFCLTDSGGLQEEGAALGKPVLVMRACTERPEALRAGVLRLVGTREDDIVSAALALLRDETLYASMARPSAVFGDGHAGERIADVIERGECDIFAP